MYLKLKKKIEIKECNTFKSRLKSLRFHLQLLDYGLHFPNKKLANTYYFCQRVDICFTDKNDIIIALYENIRSEKLIYKFKSKNIYYLPLNTCKQLKKGNKLPLKY